VSIAVLTLSVGGVGSSLAASSESATSSTPTSTNTAQPAANAASATATQRARQERARQARARQARELRAARRHAIRVIHRAHRVARRLGVRLPRSRAVYHTTSIPYLQWSARHWTHRLHHLSRVWHRERRGFEAAAHARSQLGVPYVWGAESPHHGFDCSGLVRWAYSTVGIRLPRTTYSMIHSGHAVSRHRLRTGDLVFAYGDSHVGMYVGHGRVVDAPHAGAVVRISSMSAWPLTAARRVDGAR
jgi:cell wall-associated NlpC family hydrolase